MDREVTKEEKEESCAQWIKYLLITVNIILAIISCAIIGVCVWILRHIVLSQIDENDLMTSATYVMLIASGISFLTAVFGCVAAKPHNKTLLFIYVCILIFLGLLLIAGGVLSILYRNDLNTMSEISNKAAVYNKTTYEELQNDERYQAIQDSTNEETMYTMYTIMEDTIKKFYGVDLNHNFNHFITKAWDAAQSELLCCAVINESWGVYRQSEWYKIQSGIDGYDKPLVPSSCCKIDQYGDYINLEKCQRWNRGPPGKATGEPNEAIYYKGCVNMRKEFRKYFTVVLMHVDQNFLAARDFSAVLFAMSLAAVSTLLIGLILTVRLRSED